MVRWAVVKGFPNYEVSDCGQVRNVRTGRILKQRLSDRGYFRLDLYHKGKGRTMNVHILVATAFVKGKRKNLVVNHMDGDKTNNDHTNLEWCTQLQNVRHAIKTGLWK